MMVKLKARGLWSVVDPGGNDDQEDMMALDVAVKRSAIRDGGRGGEQGLGQGRMGHDQDHAGW
jgi:hypothetical protein